MINLPITGQHSLSKISGKWKQKTAIRRANSSQSERVCPMGIGVSKGVKNKPLNVENRSEHKAGLDNSRLKEFRDSVRKDGINSLSSCQQFTPERCGAYLISPALLLSGLIVGNLRGLKSQVGLDIQGGELNAFKIW